MNGLCHRGWRLDDYRQHLVHALHPAGYHTVLAGLPHVAPDPALLGFDENLSTQHKDVREVAQGAAAFLDSVSEEPFFIDIGFRENHRAFPQTTATEARYVRPPDPLPNTEATRCDMAGYRAMVRDHDAGVSVVLDANGLTDSTLVIQTTDHSVALPLMKCNLTDHGTGVLLIIRRPHTFSGERMLDSLVSQVDLFPTLCDLLEIASPGWLQGRSMMPLIRGETDDTNEAVFAEVNYHATYEP